jgi:hypothetical protein
VQHLQGFEAVVIIAPVDYFCRTEVEQVVFIDDVVCDSGFVADVFASDCPGLLPWVLFQSFIPVLFPSHAFVTLEKESIKI